MLRRRSGASLLAIAVHLLLLLMLLQLAPSPLRKLHERPKSFTLEIPPQPAEIEASPKQIAKAKPAGGEAPSKPAPPATPPPTLPTEDPPVSTLRLWEGMEKFDLAKIGPMPARPTASGSRGGGQEGAEDGDGEGPGGERLYGVEWYRKPTNAELAGYLPSRPITGWGMIACKTIEDNRVDECREIGQSPPGSGLARAVRQAAWQFRVRPPRVGGRPLIGAWIRIRIEYSNGEMKRL